MIWQDYELDECISKAAETLTLWKTERALVEIDKDTLIVAIKQGDMLKGYVFHGNGKLLLDTIVETEEGAIGKSIDRRLNEPFLMLSDAQDIQKHLDKASDEDLRKMGYENQQGFSAKAEELLEKTLTRGRIRNGGCCSNHDGSIFAFPNEEGKPDVLVLNGSKVVYVTKSTVFVANENRTVLKSSEQVILSKHGRSFIINR
jgi:hypothetical protein